MKDNKDEINSKTGCFIRQYFKGPLLINFELTKEEMIKIRERFFSEKLYKLPDNFRPVSSNNSMPSFDNLLVIYYNGKKKSFIYNSDFEYSNEKDVKIIHRMKSFMDYIKGIVLEKESIKKLPPCDLLFI